MNIKKKRVSRLSHELYGKKLVSSNIILQQTGNRVNNKIIRICINSELLEESRDFGTDEHYEIGKVGRMGNEKNSDYSRRRKAKR